MLAVVVIALVGATLSAHNASQGTSAFLVHNNGKIDIEVEVLETDLPELCDVEINLADRMRRLAAEQKLEECIALGMPRWLRLRVDDVGCRVLAGRYRHGAGLQIVLEADALCDAPAGHTLTLDWGLFQTSYLDHQSTSTLTLPDGTQRRALLSKRKNKLSIEIRDPRALAAKAAAATAAAVVAVVVALGLWRRRRHRLRA